MTKCFGCEHYYANNQGHSIRMKGKWMNPGESFCVHGKPHKLGIRDIKAGMTPLWCPFGEHKGCLICGRLIRNEEEYCNVCKKERK